MKKLWAFSVILIVVLLFAGCELFDGSKTTMTVVNGSSEEIVAMQINTYIGAQERTFDGLQYDALNGERLALDAEVTIDLPPVLAEGSSMELLVHVGVSTICSIYITYDAGADFTLTYNGSTETPQFTITGTGAEEVNLE